MLFTPEETAEWKRREEEAFVEQPGDDWGTRWKRKDGVLKAAKLEKIKRMRARPDRVLQVVIVSVGEKCAIGFTPKEMWGDGAILKQRYDAANTPETRWIVATILKGILRIPSSWGRSAATRFFRGTGKQKTVDLPGSCILSAERGWTTRQANTMVEIFYDSEISPLFVEDASGEIEITREEQDEIYQSGGDPHAITQKEKDLGFISSMVAAIEAQGTVEPLFEVKEKKVYVPKELKPGTVITQSNVRDVTPGSHLEMVAISYDGGYGNKDEFSGKEYKFDLVVTSRSVGTLQIRPVLKGTAFGERSWPSAGLYKRSYRRDQVKTTYVGKWEGPVVDVEIGRDAWVARTTKSIMLRRVREGSTVKIETIK